MPAILDLSATPAETDSPSRGHRKIGATKMTELNIEILQNRIANLTDENNRLELALEAMTEEHRREAGAAARFAERIQKATALMQNCIDFGQFDDEIEEIWLEELAEILDLDLKQTEDFEVVMTIEVTVTGTKKKGYTLSEDDFYLELDVTSNDSDVVEVEMTSGEDITHIS
jgi:hypothetical protein